MVPDLSSIMTVAIQCGRDIGQTINRSLNHVMLIFLILGHVNGCCLVYSRLVSKSDIPLLARRVVSSIL